MTQDTPSYLKTLESLLTNYQAAPDATPLPVEAAQPAAVTTVSNPVTTKLNLLLVSTHSQQVTGYSKVSHNIIHELAKLPWLNVMHFGFQKMQNVPEKYRPYPSNVDIIDAASLEKPAQQGFGFAQLPDVIRQKKPHVVMIFNDMSVNSKFLEEIRKSGVKRDFQIWVYCDQVYNCQLQGHIDILNRDTDRVFAFTKKWKDCLKEQGITRPVDTLVHGFDKKMFYTVPKEMARKMLGVPNDAFLYLNLNRNQPRKRYDILIMAFVELVVKYPQKPVFLLCVCDKGDKGGWPILELYARELKARGVPVEQFGNRLILTNQDMCFKDDDINMFLNVADVGVNTADGEGWGLCNFEQMGVGVPQVVPAIGGFNEFCNANNSVLVKPKHKYYLPLVFSPVGGEAWACDPHDFCLGMEEYLLDSVKREAHAKAAKETVLGYTWAKATELLTKRLQRALTDLSEEE